MTALEPWASHAGQIGNGSSRPRAAFVTSRADGRVDQQADIRTGLLHMLSGCSSSGDIAAPLPEDARRKNIIAVARRAPLLWRRRLRRVSWPISPAAQLLLALSILGAAAALGAVETGSSAAEKRVALSGYDPVSYFTDGRPEKGSAEYSAAFDDATYWFKSAEHRALFVADPDHYAPQFDGYCAIIVSRGEKHEADPEAWAIADGKLYVFGARRTAFHCSSNRPPASSRRRPRIGRSCASIREAIAGYNPAFLSA